MENATLLELHQHILLKAKKKKKKKDLPQDEFVKECSEWSYFPPYLEKQKPNYHVYSSIMDVKTHQFTSNGNMF